jgi:hypothetical protein
MTEYDSPKNSKRGDSAGRTGVTELVRQTGIEVRQPTMEDSDKDTADESNQDCHEIRVGVQNKYVQRDISR